MKTICFYHSADLDGIASAAIVKRFEPDCELYPINYGQPFPWDDIGSEDTVYMVDFSLQPFGDMVNLRNACREFIWIDHHKSAIDEYYKHNAYICGIREIGYGACEFVWQYLGQKPTPYPIKLLADYDVWNHKNEDVRPFQYGMQYMNYQPEDQDKWRVLFGDDGQARQDAMVKYICSTGKPIYEWAKRDMQEYVSKHSFKTELDGMRVLAVNRMKMNSIGFEHVFTDYNEYDCVSTFGYSNWKWIVSLYGVNGSPDLSEVAKRHGGGGHERAAGFSCDRLPFGVK